MNIVNIENISKIYGEKVIFDETSFGIQQIRSVSLESTEPVRLHSFGWSAERKFLTADRSSDRTD